MSASIQIAVRNPVPGSDSETRTGPDDARLMVAIARGDKQAFTEFVTRHIDSIIDFAMRYQSQRADAEDIVQQAFTRLWLKAAMWQDQDLPAKNWLYRVTYNLCIDAIRKRRPEVSLDDDEPLASALVPGLVSMDSPETIHYHNQLALQVESALQQLSERQHTAIVLCTYQGLSNTDAAIVMDISVEALESLLARGRRKLRKLLPTVEG